MGAMSNEYTLHRHPRKVVFVLEGKTGLCLVKNLCHDKNLWCTDHTNCEADDVLNGSSKSARKASGGYWVTVEVAREIWNHYRSKGYVQCG
jgi:hypothetical protein